MLAAAIACTVFQLGAGQSATQAQDGSVDVTAYVHNLAGACTMNHRLVLALRLHGKLVKVRGNPAAMRLTGPLAKNGFWQAKFIWRNWCGSKDVKLYVTVPGAAGSANITKLTPRCVARGKPSTLVRRN